MYSKFDCYNFASSSHLQKETKLQKYLRSKKGQILAKCFDIKDERRDVQSNQEPLKQMETTVKEKLPDEPTKTDCQQSSREEHVIDVTVGENKDELSLPAAIANDSETCVEAIKIQFQPLAVKRVVETADKKPVNAAKFSSNLKQSFYSKTVNPKRSTSTNNDWKSPFRTVITNGLRKRPQSSEFAYHLSRDEYRFAGQFSSAMKPAPESERQLLKQGQRRDYLMQRYEHSPVVKYNYPEATSWRIGWLQQNHKL